MGVLRSIGIVAPASFRLSSAAARREKNQLNGEAFTECQMTNDGPEDENDQGDRAVWQCPDCGFVGNSPDNHGCIGCGFLSHESLDETGERRTSFRNEGYLAAMLHTVKRCLASLLLLLPLAAILLMVIYGIPKLTPVVAQSGWEDPATAAIGQPPARGRHGEMNRSRPRERAIPPTIRRPTLPSTPESPAAPRRGWSETMQRLHAAGVVRYRVQPGRRLDEVHFSCVVTSMAQPRLVRRYETEADTPLAAARDVLQQIEENRGLSRLVVSMPRVSVGAR